MRYIALVDGEPGAYGVSFPDLPGCNAMGETVEQALFNAVPALAEWMQDVRSQELPLPEPRSFDALLNDEDVLESIHLGGAFLTPIPYLPEAGSKWVRVNLSLDPLLVDEIDAAAKERGINRSTFVARAARYTIASGA